MMELMKKLPPAGIDSEIRSLAPEHGGSIEELQYFMEFMLSQLKRHMNFELIEAYLGLFLKVLYKHHYFVCASSLLCFVHFSFTLVWWEPILIWSHSQRNCSRLIQQFGTNFNQN